MGRRLIDLNGKTFGRLRVLRLNCVGGAGAMWHCACECGAELCVYGHLLRRGQVKSCGCLRKDVGTAALAAYAASGAPHAALKHGDSKASGPTSEWTAWYSMRKRCENPRNAAYVDYGGRGIAVCERWSDYPKFLEDVGRKPSPEHTLERIRVNEGYKPDNVRWATRVEQARNRRNTYYIECDGVRRSLAEWSEKTGLKNTTIRARLRSGWTEKEALFTPNSRIIA